MQGGKSRGAGVMSTPNSKLVATLCAGVASAVLIAFISPASAGGLSVSVGGHSVASGVGGGIGGAVGGAGGSLGGLGGSVGGISGGISSGLGGGSDMLNKSQGFFSGGAHFAPRGATSNFFAGGANAGNTTARRATHEYNRAKSSTTVQRSLRASKRVTTRAASHIPTKSVGGQNLNATTSPQQETASVGGTKGVNAKVVNDPEAQVTIGDGQTQGATIDSKVDQTGTGTPVTTTVQGLNSPSSTTGSRGNAGVAP